MSIAHRACRATLLSWESDANTCELLCQPKLYSLTMSLRQMPPILPATCPLAHENGPDLLARMRCLYEVYADAKQVWPEMVAEMTKEPGARAVLRHSLFVVCSRNHPRAGI